MKIEDIKVNLKVGQELEVQLTDPPPKLSELIRGVWLPVKIIGEYQWFFIAEVLPHINPILSWGMSRPYRLSLGKFDIMRGGVKIRDGRKEGS